MPALMPSILSKASSGELWSTMAYLKKTGIDGYGRSIAILAEAMRSGSSR
jgi:hypothetical protein